LIVIKIHIISRQKNRKKTNHSKSIDQSRKQWNNQV
jgi:hypothetical protein